MNHIISILSLLEEFSTNVVSNNIEFLSTLAGDDSSILLFQTLLVSVDDTDFFQDLEGLSNDLTSGSVVMVSGVTESLLFTIDFLQSTDTNVSSQIDLSGNGG